jgi:hypothetical protein
MGSDHPDERGVNEQPDLTQDQRLAKDDDERPKVNGVPHVPIETAHHQALRQGSRDRRTAGTNEPYERPDWRNQTQHDHRCTDELRGVPRPRAVFDVPAGDHPLQPNRAYPGGHRKPENAPYRPPLPGPRGP